MMERESLSPAGWERRERMLVDLKREVSRIRRRRKATRMAGAALCAALIGTVIISRAGSSLREPPAPREIVEAPAPAASFLPVLSHLRLDVVEDRPIDPGVLVSDEEMLSILARNDRPAGLVRVGGTVFLTQERQAH